MAKKNNLTKIAKNYFYILFTTPLGWSLILATLMFAMSWIDLINFLSPHRDAINYDHFTLPRCGLAVRNGTSLYSSGADYSNYGYFSTEWMSLPYLCILFGVPTSFLPPSVSVVVMKTIYWIFHLLIIILLGNKFGKLNKKFLIKDYIMFFAIGFFFPWYVIYLMGQYHVFAVFGLALILSSEKRAYVGFMLSIIGKPLLAPAGLIALLRRKKKLTITLVIISLFLYIPWFFLTMDKDGYKLGINHSFFDYLKSAGLYSKFSVYRWNQEMGLPKLLDEFFTTSDHYYIRISLALGSFFSAAWALRKSPIQISYIVATLCFFFLYGRAHEYHLTLYIPMFLYLYSLRDEYRDKSFIFIVILAALPTTFSIFMKLYNFQRPGDASMDIMYELNKPLFWSFVSHKAIIPFLLLIKILIVELKNIKKTLPNICSESKKE